MTDAAWFSEELQLLAINKTRIFRQAEHERLELPDEMPNIEAQALADVPDLEDIEDAFAELDAARDGEDAVSAEIAKWREELAATSG